MKKFVVMLLLFAVFISTVDVFASARDFNDILEVSIEKTYAEIGDEIVELLDFSDSASFFPKRLNTTPTIPSVLNAGIDFYYERINLSVFATVGIIHNPIYTWTIGSVG